MPDITFDSQAEIIRNNMVKHFIHLWDMTEEQVAEETKRLKAERESVVSHGAGSHGLAPNNYSGHGL